MEKRLCKIFKVIGLVLVRVLLYLSISYERAKRNTVQYLQIVNINKENYQNVKSELYNIVSPEIQQLVFSNSEYIGAAYPPISYKVN